MNGFGLVEPDTLTSDTLWSMLHHLQHDLVKFARHRFAPKTLLAGCFLLSILGVLNPPFSCRGDFVIYSLPGTKSAIILEGKTKVHAGQLVEFTYPGFASVTMSLEDAYIVKAPSRQEEFRRLFQNATKSGRVEDYLEAARQALQRGMLKEFYECCSAAYKRNPDHATLKRLIQARKNIKKPLSDHARIEAQARETTNLKNMKFATSQHYVMLHDTSDIKGGRKRQTRAEARLELLELVYESYFMKFAFDGVVLEPPAEPMMVLLFADEATYLRYATMLDPKLQMASGFWSPKDNISVFFDQGTTEEMKVLTEVAKSLQKTKAQLRGTVVSKDIAHLANSFDLLIKIAKEESDTEVVSHEATHQLAGNTGLMPRGKLGLTWAHEGLASYFETPAGAGWGGVGAVNATRLSSYRRVARDPTRSSLKLLVSDMLFDAARGQAEVVDAYGNAWALTHFLMENHFEKLVDYYRRCSEVEEDADGKILRSALVDIFNDVFGDMRLLERDFHSYMATLKPDMERMRDAMK
jgi:hypothetical protein